MRTPLKKKACFVLPEEQENGKEYKQKDNRTYDHEEHQWNNDDTLTRINNLAHRIKDKIVSLILVHYKRLTLNHQLWSKPAIISINSILCQLVFDGWLLLFDVICCCYWP